LALELKRKERQGLIKAFTERVLKGTPAKPLELFSAALVGFIIGYKLLDAVLNYGDFVADPQGFILSMKGSILGGIAGGGLTAFLKYWEKNKQRLEKPKWVEETIHPHELIGNVVMISAIAGLLGAKLFHNLENLDELLADPIGALLAFSGLTFYGGMICATLAVLYYVNKKGIHFIHMLDAAGPGLLLAYGVGRIGCQIAGDGDWGIPNDMPQPEWLAFLPEWTWAYDYPNNVLGVVLQQDFENNGFNSLTGKAYPTPLYEAILGIGLFGVLWSIRKKITIPGMLFCIYLIVNGVERFFIEKIRVNEVYEIFGNSITQAEIISTTMVFCGIIGIWYFRRKGSAGEHNLDKPKANRY